MIPKPNKDQSEAKNYLPISLLSFLGKLFERLLAGRLSSYLEKKVYSIKTKVDIDRER